jgi:hypothetical protein
MKSFTNGTFYEASPATCQHRRANWLSGISKAHIEMRKPNGTLYG